MDRAKLEWIATLILSPTRVWAKSRIAAGKINSAAALRWWNFQFQLVTAVLFLVSILACNSGIKIWAPIIVAAGYFALGRMNELLIAFYNDVFDKIAGVPRRIPLTRSERIKLLATGYVETIILYGLMHLAAQTLPHGSYSVTLCDAFDATYFSAMTITTTGFGDISPVGWLARLLTMFEAVTGIVYLALALAVYLSVPEPERPQSEPDKIPNHD